MNGKTCGQCLHFHSAGYCWRYPPKPTPGGTMMRPKVAASDLACGEFRSMVGYPVVATARSAPVSVPTPDEARAIAAAMEERGELHVDRTPGPKGAPKGKRGGN